MNKTYMPKQDELNKACYLIDAADQVLGKVAVKAATVLRGKHKPIYTPHLDTGDMVVIINAEKVVLTGKKMKDKAHQRYSGYPSGQRTMTIDKMMVKNPTQVIRLAVNRMIPKGRLGNAVRGHLRIYAGDQHPHQAQQPIPLAI